MCNLFEIEKLLTITDHDAAIALAYLGAIESVALTVLT